MKYFFIAIGVVVVLAIVSIFLIPKESGAVQSNDPDVVAVAGMHWHPQLRIFVKGREIEIPQNIGIGAVHQPMHTHDDLPLIHLEFPGMVRKSDITLGRFFKIWGKDMRSFGSNMHMTVNGAENTDFENYIMHDGDKIELRYD